MQSYSRITSNIHKQKKTGNNYTAIQKYSVIMLIWLRPPGWEHWSKHGPPAAIGDTDPHSSCNGVPTDVAACRARLANPFTPVTILLGTTRFYLEPLTTRSPIPATCTPAPPCTRPTTPSRHRSTTDPSSHSKLSKFLFYLFRFNNKQNIFTIKIYVLSLIK